VSISDNFMDALEFDEGLTPSDSDVSPEKVLSREFTLDYTEGLVNEFIGQGYVENETLFTFPYDWRYGASGEYTDGTTNADLLAQKIQDILQQTGADKVDVVAHSLGGLIVKKYIAEHPADHNIQKAVFVGVPNTGAPKAVKVLLWGDNFGIPWLADSEVKKISKNLPVSYDLLPSQQYYNVKGSFVKVIDHGEPLDFFDGTEKDLNYQEFENYLAEDYNLNSSAFDNAEILHAQTFDDFDMRTAGVDLYSITGCKAGTLSQVVEIRYKDILGGEYTAYGQPKQSPGDGTVPLESSTNLPIDQDRKFYLLSADHSKMLSQNGGRQEIVNLISGSSLNTGKDIFGNDLVTQDIGKCQLNGKAISVFSPINIFVADQNGNRLGLAEDQSIINEIPNADFEIWGDRKFVYLPIDGGQVYTISLAGAGAGTFTIKAEDIQNSQTTKTEVFSNLPVTLELTGSININPTDNTTSLTVKQDANSESVTILASSTFDASQPSDFLPPNSIATLTGDLSEPGIYKSDAAITIEATDSGSGVLDIEYNLDNAGYIKIAGDSASFTVLSEGNHTLYFFSADKAGNNEQEQTINFKIEKPAEEPESEEPVIPEPKPVIPELPEEEEPVARVSGGGGAPIIEFEVDRWGGNASSSALAVAPAPIIPLLVLEPIKTVTPTFVENEVLKPIIVEKAIKTLAVVEISKPAESELAAKTEPAPKFSPLPKAVAAKEENLFLASLVDLGEWMLNLLFGRFIK